MKRALIFSLSYYPRVGGAEVALNELTERMPDIEFHMLTLAHPGTAPEEKIGNVYVHRIGIGPSYLSKIFFIPHATLRARSMHMSLHFDLFWAMMSYMVLPI